MSLILQFFPAVLPFHALHSPFSRVQTGPVGFFQIIEFEFTCQKSSIMPIFMIFSNLKSYVFEACSRGHVLF